MIQTKRIYEDVLEDDGYRILVDRLWPRGISKERGHLNDWLKEVAPSNELRKWFNHEPEKFEEFKKQYAQEIQEGKGKEAFLKLKQAVQNHPTVTLVYAAKNKENNQAVCLKEWLE